MLSQSRSHRPSKEFSSNNNNNNNNNNNRNNNNNNININNQSSRNYQSNDFEFELLVQTYLHDVNYSSRNEAIAKISYSVLNAGLVALPYAAYKSGVLLFSFGIIIVALFSGYTTCMVINMANEHNVRTLEDLGEKAFGKWGFYLTSLCQIMFSLSLLCITLNVWSEITLSVVQDYSIQNEYSSYITSRKVHIFIGGLIVLPICVFTRSISTLKFTPYLTVLTILAALVAVSAAFTNDITSNSSYSLKSQVLFPTLQGWVISFVIPFCFSFNQKALTVYSCLRRRDSERWQYTVTRALIVVSCIYLLVGILGFLSYSMRNADLDSLNYFQSDSLTNKQTLYNIIRSLIALSLLFTFPVDCLVASTALRRLSRRYIQSTFQDSQLCKTFVKPGSRRSSDLSRPRTLSINSNRNNNTFMNFWGFFFGSKRSNRPSDHSNISNISNRQQENWEYGWDFDPMVTNSSIKSDRLIDSTISYEIIQDNEISTRESNKSKESYENKTSNKLTTSSFSSVANSDELLSKFDKGISNLPSKINQPNHYETTDTNENKSDITSSIIVYNNKKQSFYSLTLDCLPGLLFWGLGLGFCIGLNMWTVVAGSFGTLSTALLVYILPSAMYFRLGLSTDFQAIPILGLIPNHIYMTIVQIFGCLLLLGNIALFFCFVLL